MVDCDRGLIGRQCHTNQRPQGQPQKGSLRDRAPHLQRSLSTVAYDLPILRAPGNPRLVRIGHPDVLRQLEACRKSEGALGQRVYGLHPPAPALHDRQIGQAPRLRRHVADALGQSQRGLEVLLGHVECSGPHAAEAQLKARPGHLSRRIRALACRDRCTGIRQGFWRRDVAVAPQIHIHQPHEERDVLAWRAPVLQHRSGPLNEFSDRLRLTLKVIQRHALELDLQPLLPPLRSTIHRLQGPGSASAWAYASIAAS